MGIARYENKEEKISPILKIRIKGTEWSEAQSPYILQDQKLQSWIFVKAIDKAGNERVAELAPQKSLKWYEDYLIWFIIIVAVLIGLLGLLIFKKYGGEKYFTNRH